MHRNFPTAYMLAAAAVIVTATSCTAVSNLQTSSSPAKQDNTIIVMGNGITYLGD